VLTDEGLMAVTPAADEKNDANQAGTEGGGPRIVPETMPSATHPTTTRPARGKGETHPTTEPATEGNGGGGKVEVPRAMMVQEAILVGLQNNSSLKVQKYNVPLQRTGEEIQRAAFDPTVSAQIAGGRTAVPTSTTSTGGKGTSYTDQINAQIAAAEFLPTGTTITAAYTTNNAFYSDAASSSGLSATVTQSLLRGAGMDVNLASLRQAVLATKISQYELRGFAEALVAEIEQTYWDLAFAERQVVIVENALGVAQKQLDETNALIELERSAPSERAAAEAEVALRKENLIDAKSTLETTRIRFLQLITPVGRGGGPFWNQTVALRTLPAVPEGKMDPVESHVAVALKLRPEINETKLQIQQGDLQVVRTKNGLLPQLDLFVTLGQTGYAGSFGGSVTAFNGPDYNVLAGLRGSYDIGNRAERASHRAAVLGRDQSVESLVNLEQTVQVDVRTQYIEVERTRQQIDATKATRIAQETAFHVEQEKFKLGKSTSLLVAQAQRDLLSAQLAEVQAVTGHLKALVQLYRLEGSLLYRRGIAAPGGEEVKAEAWKR